MEGIMAATTTQPFIPCDDSCMFAKGNDCECPCGGVNHQVGTKGLMPTAHAYVYRTTAGRRINPALGDKAELAEWMRAQEEGGMTRKEIAKAAKVSASTVRRLIRSLELAEELVEAQEQELELAA
jgi:hypothetical protein